MIEETVRIVARLSEIEDSKLYGESHGSDVCTAKYVCWHYLHSIGISISVLMRHFGRSRRVVYYGINKIKGWLEYDSDFKERYDAIKHELEERLKKD